MAMQGCVWLCIAVYGYVGLCKVVQGYVGRCVLINVKPLYDAYTTFLPLFRKTPMTLLVVLPSVFLNECGRFDQVGFQWRRMNADIEQGENEKAGYF